MDLSLRAVDSHTLLFHQKSSREWVLFNVFQNFYQTPPP